MDTKRVLISAVLGLLFGGICAYGSVGHIPSELPMAPILASIFYNRVLLGFVIGIANSIEISPALRGAVLGIVVSAAIAIPTGVIESKLAHINFCRSPMTPTAMTRSSYIRRLQQTP